MTRSLWLQKIRPIITYQLIYLLRAMAREARARGIAADAPKPNCRRQKGEGLERIARRHKKAVQRITLHCFFMAARPNTNN
jgi:hypothetical protein